MVLFVPLACQAPAGKTAQVTQPDPRAAELDVWFENLMESQDLMGGALLAHEGQVLWQRTFGSVELEANSEGVRSLSEASIYEMASVGKAFTAMAILTLVDAEKVELDAPVATYLNDFPFSAVTVRQLVNHTSGVPDYLGSMDPEEMPTTGDGFLHNEDVLAWLAGGSDALEFVPGSAFNYSNSNYVCLASIVEAVSGEDFGAYLAQHVLGPLGMQRTFSFTTRFANATADSLVSTVPEDYAFGYQRNADGALVLPESLPENAGLQTASTMLGDGTVVADLRDFAKWEAAWTTDVLIPEPLRTSAFTPATLTTGEPSNYGFAWGIDGNSTGHTGGWPGYSTAVFLDRETRTVFVMALTAPVNDWSFMEELQPILFE